MVLLATYFNDFTSTLSGLFDEMFTPLISIASALAVVWAVYLGIKFWLSSGDENKRKEAKSAVISFVVGTVVIFAVAVGAPLLIAALAEWLSDNEAYITAFSYLSADWSGNNIAGGMQYLTAA